MSQNRPPPAYQEYAGEMLANLHFRLLSAAQRGVFWTIRLECWRNERIPAGTEQLALLTGLNHSDISNAIPVLHENNLIHIHDCWISCPDLDDYRKSLLEKRIRQSEGGKKGSKTTNKIKKLIKNNSVKTASNTTSNTTSNTELSHRVQVESLDKVSEDKFSLEKLSNQKEEISTATPGVASWLEEYENEPEF